MWDTSRQVDVRNAFVKKDAATAKFAHEYKAIEKTMTIFQRYIK